jgi:hypothetical protein
MKIYRYEYGGAVYSIVDNEDDRPLIVHEVGVAAGNVPMVGTEARIYRALHMLDVWQASGKPGEVP